MPNSRVPPPRFGMCTRLTHRLWPLKSRSVPAPGWLASVPAGAPAALRRSSRPLPDSPDLSGLAPAPACSAPARRPAPSNVRLEPGSRPVGPSRAVQYLPRSLAGLYPVRRMGRPALAGCSAAFHSRETPLYFPLRSFGPLFLPRLLCRLLTCAARSGRITPPSVRIPDGRQISRGKLVSLRRTTAGFTVGALDGSGLRRLCRLVGRRLPRIRFLSIGSRLCSTLAPDPALRRRPCVSLGLHLYQTVQGTHPQAAEHARHTRKGGASAPPWKTAPSRTRDRTFVTAGYRRRRHPKGRYSTTRCR